MLKETYTPRVGYAVIDTVILRPKEEKAIFINKEANNSIIKDEDILTYRVKAIAKGCDLKEGQFIQMVSDLKSPGLFGTIVPLDTIISTIEYEGLDDYNIKTYAELTEEYEQTKQS
jgi:hypothetical protein